MKQNEFLEKFKNEYQQMMFDQSETLQWLHKNKIISMSWGCHNTIKLSKTGLLFNVQGYHHKGLVLITLSFNDTYTVRFLDNEYNEVKETLTDVYCDELQEKIDVLIEKIEKYSF